MICVLLSIGYYHGTLFRNFNAETYLSSIQPADSAAAIDLSSKSELTEKYPIYTGKYDFNLQGNGVLNFVKGDLMYVINTENLDWWFARLKDNGKEGYVLRTYLEAVIEK